jgi:hypothetical protein
MTPPSTDDVVYCSPLGVEALWRLDSLRTRWFPPLKAEEEERPIMASPHEIESARLSMVEARKALEDYETLKGYVSSSEHTRLTQVFTRATGAYLKLSASRR